MNKFNNFIRKLMSIQSINYYQRIIVFNQSCMLKILKLILMTKMRPKRNFKIQRQFQNVVIVIINSIEKT